MSTTGARRRCCAPPAHRRRCLSASVSAAHQPRERRDAEDGDRPDDVGHARAEDRDDADRQQDAGKGEQHVADAHDDAVPPAFEEAADQPEHGADACRRPRPREARPRARCAPPHRMRLKMSRPSASTPNQCCAEGRASTCRSREFSASNGAIQRRGDRGQHDQQDDERRPTIATRWRLNLRQNSDERRAHPRSASHDRVGASLIGSGSRG